MKSVILKEAPDYRLYEDGRVERIKIRLLETQKYKYKKSIRAILRKDRFIKPVVCTKGYYQVGLRIKKKRKIFFIHRLLAEYFINGHSKNKNEINHINGNKLDNRLTNLEWCDHLYNIRHYHLTHKPLYRHVKTQKPTAKIEYSPAIPRAVRIPSDLDSILIKTAERTEGGITAIIIAALKKFLGVK